MGGQKKEYPPDLTLPDIKNGIYGTDEFQMYSFKIKPCSCTYSHDWTECPFVHPVGTRTVVIRESTFTALLLAPSSDQ
ncbi:hypothetical protein IHE45_18G034800 [Dioscorea alata]|uniref:Uncharacterized protein n=1 Tax=Dioscorea alata TaxID=55571 RepID=A0ACB7U694_DIOAL|nr:hypothetical protein IHE45_18G034800 [Dioscorea alata]